MRTQCNEERIRKMNKMLCNKLIHDCFKSVVVFGARPMASQYGESTGNRMKMLNEQKAYGKALELFDQYKETHSTVLSSFMINQALKACTKTHDLQRGAAIHRLVLPRVKQDSYIATSLIHLYSKFSESMSRLR